MTDGETRTGAFAPVRVCMVGTRLHGLLCHFQGTALLRAEEIAV